jgi:Na+/proline symporter
VTGRAVPSERIHARITHTHREAVMKKLRIWATVTLTLGILALVVLFFMHLALTDIYHGEENASLEWGILRLGFLVIFFLIVATFVCTGLVLKYFRDRSDQEKPKLT